MAARVGHWFPGLAAGVGGDPNDLPCSVLKQYDGQICDMENWKNGEKDGERKQRRLERILGDVT